MLRPVVEDVYQDLPEHLAECGRLGATEHKNLMLGLISLKQVSDAFEQLHFRLQAQIADGSDLEACDEYLAGGSSGGLTQWQDPRQFSITRISPGGQS